MSGGYISATLISGVGRKSWCCTSAPGPMGNTLVHWRDKELYKCCEHAIPYTYSPHNGILFQWDLMSSAMTTDWKHYNAVPTRYSMCSWRWKISMVSRLAPQVVARPLSARAPATSSAVTASRTLTLMFIQLDSRARSTHCSPSVLRKISARIRL